MFIDHNAKLQSGRHSLLSDNTVDRETEWERSPCQNTIKKLERAALGMKHLVWCAKSKRIKGLFPEQQTLNRQPQTKVL
jgi:hypothetical protein